MQVIDFKFDAGQGDIVLDVEKGLIQLNVTDKNPALPSNAQINLPLAPVLQQIKDKVSNPFVKIAVSVLQWCLT